MVPRSRLLFWFAWVVLPFAALGPLVPGTALISLLAIGCFGLVVLADAVIAERGLLGVRVSLPETVRLQKDRPGVIVLTVHRENAFRQFLRLGVALPARIEPAIAERTVLFNEGIPEARVDWACTPSARGQYLVEHVYVEASSPLGFWARRRRQDCRSEIRVYPNLFAERRQVAALFLRRGQFGIHTQRQVGQGREFEKLRNYLPGDSLGDIHWKASAKRGEAVTKVYQVERSHEVYVVIDASRLLARPLPGDSGGDVPAPGNALERAVTSALILALAAEQQGDQFGLITFSDRVLKCVRAGTGQAHFDVCRDALYTLEAQSVSPDFEELATFVRLHLRRRALLVILTALDDPVLAESFINAAELISRQHLVLVNMLQPGGLRPLFSETPEIESVGDVYRELSGHLQWQKVRELQKILRRRGVRLSLLDPAKLSAELVAQHAEVRARQLI